MSLDALIMLAGVLVGVLPFLGFPPSWTGPILFVLGIFIFSFGIVVRRRGIGESHQHDEQFVDSRPQREPLSDGEVA